MITRTDPGKSQQAMSAEGFNPDCFGGIVRLFPLPDLVFFPHVIQPLHIFEPRYRQMTSDALADDHLITLVQLRAGQIENDPSPPAIHPVACLGRIVAAQKLEDGRFNLLLQGVSRIRIVDELPGDKLYRCARVELLDDQPCASAHTEAALRRRLAKRMLAWFHAKAPVMEQFQKLIDSDLSLGALCDIFSFALPLDSQFKQTLLEQLDVKKRVRALLRHMETTTTPTDRKFPPDFSSN
jgi:Lon protease-like protein